MRIIHEESTCASLGMCEAIAPALFEVGADGALILLDPAPPPRLRSLVQEAVAACPTGSLRLEQRRPPPPRTRADTARTRPGGAADDPR